LFVDGAVKGINIARLIREAKARFEGKQLPPEPGPLQTDFAELRGTVTLTNGMASNTDLYAKSPLLRVTGEGTANLVKEQLNYLLTATVVATTKGQGGKDLQDLEGVSIPIRIEGNFDQPQVALDLEALLKSQAEALVQKKKKDLLKKVEEGLDEKLKKQLGDQPQELLRKLFQ
jgi:AsmA protein